MRKGTLAVAVFLVLAMGLMPVPTQADDEQVGKSNQDDVQPLGLAAVTGHTTWIDVANRGPGPTPAVTREQDAAHRAEIADRLRHDRQLFQAECIAWTSGITIDALPAGTLRESGRHAHPTDADEADPPGPSGMGDASSQDHDFDAVLDSCTPLQDNAPHAPPVGLPSDHAVVSGDTGSTGGADFVAVTERGDCSPALGTDYQYRGHLDFTDPNGVYHEVIEFSYGCPSGERELVWVTTTHAPLFDPAVEAWYDFALAVDTCDAANIHDVAPAARPAVFAATGLCTSGSAESFDDTDRTRVVHDAAPGTAAEAADGVSWDNDPGSPTYERHRQHCRNNLVPWLLSTSTPGDVNARCLGEDHMAAAIDLYALDADPTGRWHEFGRQPTQFSDYRNMDPPSADLDPYPDIAPPVAHIRPIATATCTAGGADAVLDASGSTDPQGFPLTYQWDAPGAIIADAGAQVTTARLPVGETLVSLTVDSLYRRSVAATTAHVVDAGPNVTILEPRATGTVSAAGHQQTVGDEIQTMIVGAFTVRFHATDACYGKVERATLHAVNWTAFEGSGPYEVDQNRPAGERGPLTLRASAYNAGGRAGHDTETIPMVIGTA